MKQRILVAAASIVLAALILLLLPADLSPGLPPLPTGPNRPTAPNDTTPTTQPADPGVVRLYCCDTEKAAILAQLAADYSALTGTEVVLLSAGEAGCQATVQTLMESEDPPTILCLHSQADLVKWQGSLLDLSGTGLDEALYADAFGWRVDGKLLALPMELEGMGLLFNAQMLSVALSRNDIVDYTSLATAVQIMKNNGLKAFSNVPSLDLAWLELLNSSDPDTLRAFLNLHMANNAGEGDGLQQFAAGKAVFYLGTTGVYGQLSQQENTVLDLRDLNILPTCTAEGMHYICSAAWGVNGSAKPADIQATVAFLTWLVTATEKAAAPVDQLQTLAPFQGAAWYGNQLEKKLRGYMKTEAATMIWNTTVMQNRDLLLALSNYNAAPTDANWAALVALLPQKNAQE